MKSSTFELLVLLLVFCSVNSSLINLKPGEACAAVCSGKENIFKYEENKIHVYSFISKHLIKNPNSKEETLQLELRGKAQVSKISACDYGLLLSDIKLKESLQEKPTMSKEYQMMVKLLETYPLRFGFDDGRITGVCQDNMDNDFAVNIKKGILSSLQVSVDSLDTPNYLTETDIAGDCITEYTTKSEPPNFVLITKTKFTAGCSRKSKYFTSISGRIHEQPKESRNLALLDGDYNCKIRVKRSEGLKESTCHESHTFRPLNTDNKGSQILISQVLKYEFKKDGKIDVKVPTTRSDLTMKHGDIKPLFMKENSDDPKIIFKKVCQNINQNAMSLKITELFLLLIRSMSRSSYEDIKSIKKYIEDDDICSQNKIKIRNFLSDVLVNVKSDAAFKFLIEDTKIYKFSKLGISIFDNPTPGMIAILSKSLDDINSYHTISIILSSMIKAFCENTPGCMFNPDIIKAMTKITNNLGSNCYSSDRKMRSKIIYSLRALNNAGSHPNVDTLLKTLKTCVLRKADDDDIKVYSTQVVRQFPCNENVDKFLWSIFDDISLNSEVRIEAYLSLVRCPTKQIFGQIIQRLNVENSQQLGSFVWSHISNLMESADRFKTDMRDMLQIYSKPIAELEKKFNLDFRSYSKNIEKTFQSGYSAAKIDSNIIFSSSSPIPSSINLNTTFELFGRSINLFDIGIRTKGINERIFGGNIKPKAHANPHPDVVKMHKKMTKNPDKLSVSFYSRIMGREVYFTPNIISDISMAYINFGSKHSFERSLLLLDTIVSVASITGFPVELQIESTASINFNMSKNKDSKLSDIELSTKLNFGIQVIGKLMVNAHCTKIGVQSKGTISKDVEFGGKLKLIKSWNSDEIDYQFEINKMPDNSKLFSISNELSLIHKLDNVASVEKYDFKLERCTGEGVMKIMGMKICLSYKDAPKYSSFFPNIKGEITIEKFSGIKMQWKEKSNLKPIKKLKSLIFSLTFPDADEDTFRIQIERDSKMKKYMYEVLLWKKMTYLKFEIDKQQITGQLKSGNTEATLSGTFGTKGIFVSEMNVDIKSDKNSGKLYFFQKFTKNGPEVILKLTKVGDKGFNLLSKTNLRLTNHSVYNFFQRLRHSTNLKYSGDNEMSFILETTHANKPLMEYKSKVEVFWQTKSKRNIYVNQVYLWQKIPDNDESKLFGSIPGYKYSITLDHDIAVKEKKFKIKNKLSYFISKHFFSLKRVPSIFKFNFKRDDVIAKKIIFETSSRFAIDISNVDDIKMASENYINYPASKISRKLNTKVTWKLNQLNMYDIDAEIKETNLKISFKHKFKNTQNGVTTADMKFGDSVYKISSELSLPKRHKLTIIWPGNDIVIDSKVNAKTLIPFDLTVIHDLKMNKKVLANIVNSAKYNNETKELFFSSVVKTNLKQIYYFNFYKRLNYDLSTTRIFCDFASSISLKLSQKNNDTYTSFSTEQFIDVETNSKTNMKKKIFVSKVLTKRTSKVGLIEKNEIISKYGYEIDFSNEKDSLSYKKISLVLYGEKSENKISLKWGQKENNFLLGISVDIEKIILAEIMYKMNVKDKKAQNVALFSLDLKKTPEYNFYLKRNFLINWSIKNVFSIKWDGEYGKSKSKKKINRFNGMLTVNYNGVKRVDVTLNMDNPIPMMSIANINYILSYNFENKDVGSFLVTFNTAVKWQFVGRRTANYVDLQMNGKFDKLFKKLKFDLVLTKDSSLNEILLLKITSSKGEDGEFYVKLGEKIAQLLLTSKMKEVNNRVTKLMLTTSSDRLKEINILLESKVNKDLTTMSYDMKINTKLENYKLMLSRIQKKNFKNKVIFTEELKWDSNIPYILSGSGFLDILSQNKIFKCDFNFVHQQKKMLDFKVKTLDIYRNLDILFQLTVEKTMKFQTKYSLDDSSLSYELDMTFGEKYFKIETMKLMYKKTKKMLTSSVNIIIKTSIKQVEELSLVGTTNYENENILNSYYQDSVVKLNKKIFTSYTIDFKKGKIILKSFLGENIVGLGLQSSERDFMFEYTSVDYNKLVTEIKLTYFLMTKNESPRITKYSKAEAMFLLDMEYKRPNCNGKVAFFIAKDLKSGVIKMQADFPQISMKVNEVILKFENIISSGNIYSGAVNYDGKNYKFTFEKSSGIKYMLQMNANEKSSIPQEVKFFLDLTKHYILQLSIDKYFDFNTRLNSLSPNSHAGIVKFIYKDKEVVNLKTAFRCVTPKEMQTSLDFLKTLFGIIQGLDLNLEIQGALVDKTVKTSIEISHLQSRFFPGGTKSSILFDVEVTDKKSKKYFIKIIFDRNLPKFNYEDQILVKTNDIIQIKKESKISYKSMKNMFMEGGLTFPDFVIKAGALNNETLVKGNYFLKTKKQENDFELQISKKTYEINFSKTMDKVKVTLETNLGYIVKCALSEKYMEIYPVGKIYYVSGNFIDANYDIQFKRKKETNIEVKLNIKGPKNEMKGVLNAFNEWKTKNSLGFEFKGETSYSDIKFFTFKSDVKFSTKLNKITLNSNLNINRKNVADLMIQYKTNNGKSPYELEVKYKGKYVISGRAMLDTQKVKITYLIEVKEKIYKTPLWTSSTDCIITSQFQCYLNYSNTARDMAVGMTWKKKINIMELSWDKKKGQGFIFICEKESKKTRVTLSSPFRTIRITRSKKYEIGKGKTKFKVEIFKKMDANEPMTFIVNYLMKGELQTDYELDLELNSSIMQKALRILINRKLNKNVEEIYSLNIKAMFDGERNKLLTFDAYLRQKSPRSYEIKINATNNEKFLAFTSISTFNYGEISLEHKIEQSGKKEKEFIFQFIPFKKFLITDKEHFKILTSRTDYQYGYRRDIVCRLGESGPNVEAFSTLFKNPFRYYAEVKENGKKLVVHFRPVGNMFIGEVYRKVSGSKELDLSLKTGVDPKNILNTNLYWNPKAIELIKSSLKNMFKPENIKSLMETAYLSSDNRISSFTSNVKLDLVKKMNIQKGLNFMKDIANDIEQIPSILTQSYGDDSLFIKSSLKSLHNYFKSFNFSEKMSQKQNNISKIFTKISNQFYDWFISAKMYSIIYDFLNENVKSISYSDIKVIIEKVINFATAIGKDLNSQIKIIGNMLDSLSERAKSVSLLFTKLKDNILFSYDGSSLNQIVVLLAEIKDEILVAFSEFIETEFIKQRITYYKESMENAKDILEIISEMNVQLMKYIKSSSIIGNIAETLKLIKSMKFKEAFVNLIKPEEAKLEMDLYKATFDIRFYIPPTLPFTIKIWKTVLDWFPITIFSQLRGSGVNGKLLALFYQYEYFIFNYGSIKSFKNMLPPFTTTAWVIQGNSFLTYDGSSIRIGPGQCSYLLARDSKTGSFSLTMNILPNGKNFELSYIQKISIHSTGMVMLNGSVISVLPQIISAKGKTVEIYRDFDVTKIKTSEGLLIEYFHGLDYLKVNLIGFWHGSIKGLLGSNDFDIINDWSTPNGRITHDAGILSQSWSLGKCISETKTGLYSKKVNTNQLKTCVNLFKGDSLSYLSRCHSVIDPEPYFQLCRTSLQYKKMNEKIFEELICNLSRNYVVRCKSQGIMIRLKKSCVTCGSLKLSLVDSQINMMKKPKFNYIFIIEQSTCLTPYVNLIDNLLKMMNLKKDNLYTLVTFNGREIFQRAHFKSLNSDISTNNKGFKTLISDLVSPSQVSKFLASNSSSKSSQAIYDAIKMPSKPGYIEKIIFIGCSSCGKHKKHLYSTLAGLLESSGISLTYITTQTFMGKGSTIETTGLGNNLVYYFDKESLKTKSWTKDLQPPNDECSSLARLKGGFVWSLSPLKTNLRMRRLAESLHAELIKIKGNPKQKCFCGTGNYEEGKMECKVRGLL